MLGDGGLGLYYGVGNGTSRPSIAIEGEMALAALAAWGGEGFVCSRWSLQELLDLDSGETPAR